MKSEGWRAIRAWAGVVVALGAVIWGVCIRFMNPDLTETRLFLEFWNTWILLVALIFLGVWNAKDWNSREE